jgi:selenide,water dikinase
MGPAPLLQVLQPLRNMFDTRDFPDLLVGLDTSDDAAVYKINDETAIIHTVDFIPPVVDDPFSYGAVAATNALNDVYAMGGKVLLALNICGFPQSLPYSVISEILRGGAEKIKQAGGVLAGGHTIVDKEPKYGLSVLGIVHPDKILSKATARPGDVIVLTKPLGTGIITTAGKADAAEPAHIEAAIEIMTKLNRVPSEFFQEIGIHALTDVTGFSLLGHGNEIAEKSGRKIVLHVERLPFLDGAERYAQEGFFPGGTCNNEACYAHAITFDPDIPVSTQRLLFTPETAGGLLAAVASEKMDETIAMFKQKNEPLWVVGKVQEGKGVMVVR